MANIIIVDADIMLKGLKLKSNELLVYAIIYGFSKDGQGCFYGSISYLAETINVSKNTIQNILKSLVDKKLIIKKEVFKNNIKFCEYQVNLEGIPKDCTPPQNLSEGIQKIDMGYTKNCGEGIPKICTNSILDNILNSIEDSISAEATPTADDRASNSSNSNSVKVKETKHRHGEYLHVLLSDTQYQKLIDQYGKSNVDCYIQKIDEWIQLKGKSPYKDYYLAILNWLKRDNVFPTTTTTVATDTQSQHDEEGWW